jgi:hypothetical protein
MTATHRPSPRASSLALACLLAVSGTVSAQAAGGACPRLDADTGLAWEHVAGPDFDFCKALDPDGVQALGVFIGKDSPFEPERRNRAEDGAIGGQPVTWYRGELAGQPDVQVRETIVELPDGRVAHVWLRADSAEELALDLEMASGLSFDPVRLGSQ